MIPTRVLMTTDAVGGVWRYSVDLARSLNEAGIEVVLACLGPAPSDDKIREAEASAATELVTLDLPLDWMASGPEALFAVPRRLVELADETDADLLHLNLPSQAAGIETDKPVVVVSHSCVVTWWAAMRNEALPADWQWQFALNRAGFERADAVIAPSRSHAQAVREAFGAFGAVRAVPNAVQPPLEEPRAAKRPLVFAAARWWDESKNAGLLDAMAGKVAWPVKAAGACRGGNGQVFTFAHVEALGELPFAETQGIMAEAGIFVSPSFYEPFGLAVLEAANAGAALVLADIPTYRELWSGAARFADPDDPAAFAREVDALAGDTAARALLGALARERARRFTPACQLEALFAAYRTAAVARAGLPLDAPQAAE
ncbi:glycosyltransferase family 4 protein [Aurantimonas sp. VKM B-3413]|uniref:glycosyltransferase family 4 protein n=1 Tax=Aurantimonas sp. VKM B-3413 TaxID=2779401 RepID=UPI001E40D7E6|nr:glycosyltransferase family 4 protein [Aurantimonas sp. VKM B-3413]MCB8839354.1 glycosyltransferase family 4 protein [Aurantimonas sp. VKM B-3413]